MYISLGDLFSSYLQADSDAVLENCGTVDLKTKISHLRLAGVCLPEEKRTESSLQKQAAPVCPFWDAFLFDGQDGELDKILYFLDGSDIACDGSEDNRCRKRETAPAADCQLLICVAPKSRLQAGSGMEDSFGVPESEKSDEKKLSCHEGWSVCPGIFLYTEEPFSAVFNRFLDLFEHWKKEEWQEETAENAQERLFMRILDGEKITQQELETELARVQGPPMHGRFWLAKLSVVGDVGTPFSMMRWTLKNRLPGIKIFKYRKDFYLLKNSPRQQTAFPTKEERAILEEVFQNVNFTCGVSNEFFCLADLSSAQNQCGEALKLGEKFLQNQAQYYYFDEVSLHYIMQELQKSVPFSMISSPYYQILKRYDEENRSNLTYIFLHFIKNSRNINRTAAEIFMHRNTVLNNVKKAYTVMQSECDNFPAQLAFMISYFEDISGRTRQ